MAPSRAGIEAELKKSPIEVKCGDCGHVATPKLGSLIGKTRFRCPKCGTDDDLSIDPKAVLKQYTDLWMKFGKNFSRSISARGIR